MSTPKRNLLVVDWDFFFPMPPAGTVEQVYHYDWGHAETGMFIDMLWTPRALDFIQNNLPLPQVNDDWKTFWDRFDIDPEATVYTDESNAGAVNRLVTDDVTGQVWLYDAHHDCGYYPTAETKKQWREGYWTCEDWMVFYGRRLGVRNLHVRYPTHRSAVFTEEPAPYFKNLERKFDDPAEETPTFHNVFVCRSGAWVPPWCDDAHQRFVHSAPVAEVFELREYYERTFDEQEIRDVAVALGALRGVNK